MTVSKKRLEQINKSRIEKKRGGRINERLELVGEYLAARPQSQYFVKLMQNAPPVGRFYRAKQGCNCDFVCRDCLMDNDVNLDELYDILFTQHMWPEKREDEDHDGGEGHEAGNDDDYRIIEKGDAEDYARDRVIETGVGCDEWEDGQEYHEPPDKEAA